MAAEGNAVVEGEQSDIGTAPDGGVAVLMEGGEKVQLAQRKVRDGGSRTVSPRSHAPYPYHKYPNEFVMFLSLL